MLYAYLDESYTGDLRTTPEYVVAGFISEAYEWKYFEKLWREDMRNLGISSIGCHAAKCNNGSGPYKSMSPDERDEIQRRLIVDIVASRLFGAVSIIDMTAFRESRAVFNETFAPESRQYNEPHIYAVRQCVQHMCLLTEGTTREPFTFVVDRNEQFGKRAKAWYELSVDNPDVRHAPRLGPYSEADRMEALGLQAADMIAWAAMREAIRTPCWQWTEMVNARVVGRPFRTSTKFWSEVATEARQFESRVGSAR